ncbi:MAG: signal recognition particle protein [Pirellulaceae bacterium]|nr:MAG: signal recognition particle protein [Pirellulaceae bacterium]
MFESLRTGLSNAFRALQGKARLTEANMREGLRLVENSLLEADVNVDVVRQFMENVSAKALGEKVLNSLDPSHQLLLIVYKELVALLGPADPTLPLKKEVNVIMMCGLQGSGKTTTCGKLARWLQERKIRPMLVAADLQRPAAIEQLQVIGRQLDVPVYTEPGAGDPVTVCRNAVGRAGQEGCKVVILDTAGRLAIDRELMDQLVRIDRLVQPDEVLLVVDGMMGQDAVQSARAFNDALELNGLIMTKLDGDARGGALLSVRAVTGVPVKFIGTGEHLDALEPLHPEGMASRILGLGDMLAMATEAQRLVDEQERQRMEQKLRERSFTLDDFKSQLEKLVRPGLLQRFMSFMPGMDQLRELMGDEDATLALRRAIGIINSMTPQERQYPEIIDLSRRCRIARGAGVPPFEVNAMLKQFAAMRDVMENLVQVGAAERLQAIQQLQQAAIRDPFSVLQRTKKGTGKRLTSQERERLRMQREKELRRRKRQQRRGG